MNELKGERTQGGERRSVADGGIGPITLPDAGVENIPHSDGKDRLRRRPRGDCEELVKVFPYRFPLHVVDLGPPHPLTVIPTASGEASEVVA